MSAAVSQATASQEFLAALAELPDPRKRACPYPLDELMFVALCGVSAGADSWTGVNDWANAQLDWLKRHLPFSNGIASHDTFSRVFSLLDAKVFEACFVRWMERLCPTLGSELISIDGKSLRGSHNSDTRMTHLVSAWHHARGMVLAQVKTAAKSNEITAIPELIDAMHVQGATITIDAMGCQHAVVNIIRDKQADYIIGVKNNQPTLAQAIENLFDATDVGHLDTPTMRFESIDKGHGRVETRRCTVIHDLAELGKHVEAWRDLSSVGRIESTREIVNGKNKGQTSTERRYYISSTNLNAEQFEASVRAHWGIENSCHWVLDMTFREDDCRIRIGDGAQNFAILRRMSLNLFKQELSSKKGLKRRRQLAGWDAKYLEAVLGMPPN